MMKNWRKIKNWIIAQLSNKYFLNKKFAKLSTNFTGKAPTSQKSCRLVLVLYEKSLEFTSNCYKFCLEKSSTNNISGILIVIMFGKFFI